MKNICKRLTAFALAGILAITIVFAGEGELASASTAKAKRRKACKAYSSWLAERESKFKGHGDASKRNKESYEKTDSFMLIDLDKNGVPELIACHPMGSRWDDIYVYTYANGKVVQVKAESGEIGQSAAISANNSANGGHEIYKCKKNHLHISSAGGWWSSDKIYRMKQGKLYLCAECAEDQGPDWNLNIKRFQVNGKKVKAKKWKSFTKKCKDQKVQSRTHLKSNTKKNRKKYLK